MSEYFNQFIPFIAEHGGPGLFLFCLLSSSILPISSEAALVAVLASGMNQWEGLAWASGGNCLGVLINYWFGRLFNRPVERKLGESRWGQKAMRFMKEKGTWCLLLSWTPFLGDPLTYAAGTFRMNFLVFALITCTLRILRYLVFVLFFL